MKKPSAVAKKAKAKELFTLSHKLLDAAKQLSEHHAAELRYNMQQAMDAAKTAAQKDMKQLNVMQKKAADEAAKRMSVYQKKVKVILKDIVVRQQMVPRSTLSGLETPLVIGLKRLIRKSPWVEKNSQKSCVRFPMLVPKYLKKAAKQRMTLLS